MVVVTLRLMTGVVVPVAEIAGLPEDSVVAGFRFAPGFVPRQRIPNWEGGWTVQVIPVVLSARRGPVAQMARILGSPSEVVERFGGVDSTEVGRNPFPVRLRCW